MRKALIFCLVSFFVFSCGLPANVYLGNDEQKAAILTRPSGSFDNITYTSTEINLDTKDIEKYDINSLIFSYRPTASNERPATAGGTILIFKDTRRISLNNLFSQVDQNYFTFDVSVTKDLSKDVFTLTVSFRDDPSLFSRTSDEVGITNEDQTHIHIYVQYYVEDLTSKDNDSTRWVYIGYFVVDE